MKVVEITNGPSREEMFDALRLFHEGRTVEFELLIDNYPHKVEVRIVSIEARLDSATSWNIKFHTNGKYIVSENEKEIQQVREYSTQIRKGLFHWE